METQIGIWLDSEKAYIINSKNKILHEIESNIEKLYRSKRYGSLTKNESSIASPEMDIADRKNHQTRDYFDAIIGKIADASKILVFGPGKTKIKFKRELDTMPEMKNKLAAVKTVDGLSHNQMKEFVRLYFE